MTGTQGKYQGSNAVVEELNKESQSWLKMSAAHSNDHWLRAFKLIDDLTEVVKHLS